MTVSLVGFDINGGNVSLVTTTDANGEYFFSVLPGSYTVTVTPPAGLSFSPKDAPGGTNTMDTAA